MKNIDCFVTIRSLVRVSMVFCGLLLSSLAFSAASERPNIVLIMVDDMGWSDIGPYGGEIPTPALDKLANNGVRFSQFYNAGRCYPTRASLMTGLHPHQSGIGSATNSPKGLTGDHGVFGYRGYLNRNSMTLAEVLKTAGYNTYMTGKWHLGYHTPDRWPLQRGFDRFYGSIAGATSYFKPQGDRGLMLGNQALAPPKENDYYTTDAFTDYAIQFIDEQKNKDPFFLYLAYTAPHWPLHGKEEHIQKFVGKYKKGWDKLRESRYKRMVELGVIDNSVGISVRDDKARPWKKLSKKEKENLDYRMAVYAAQVHSVDENVGKLVSYLEKKNALDNTLIVFMSDNGGCAEPYKDTGGKPQSWINKADFSGMSSYGLGWANASNTPFRKFKVYQNEGGISTPLIAHWPKGIRKTQGQWVREQAYLPDIMPTFVELAGAKYPEKYRGYDIQAMEGKSLVKAFQWGQHEPHEWMYWEHQGHRAVRNGQWKALYESQLKQWALYDIDSDRNESKDLASKYPDRLKSMIAQWTAWSVRAHVVPKPGKLKVPLAPKIKWPGYQEVK